MAHGVLGPAAVLIVIRVVEDPRQERSGCFLPRNLESLRGVFSGLRAAMAFREEGPLQLSRFEVSQIYTVTV